MCEQRYSREHSICEVQYDFQPQRLRQVIQHLVAVYATITFPHVIVEIPDLGPKGRRHALGAQEFTYGLDFCEVAILGRVNTAQQRGNTTDDERIQ